MRLIDADELKECFRWSEVCRLSIKEINEIIDNAPSVETPTELCKGCRFLKDCETCEEKIRPQGEWIDVVNSEYPSVWHYECSECHRRPLCTPFVGEDFLSNFCPNCGAKMKGGAE